MISIYELRREDSYSMKLRMYLDKHPGKIQYDFLINEITLHEKAIEKLSNITDVEIEEEVRARRPRYIKEDDFDKWFRKEIDARKYARKNARKSGHHDKIISELERRLNELPKPKKEVQGNLFNGKKLNLSERHKIVNELFEIDKIIRALNISDKEKNTLLSFTLGCNQTNARHLMNGKYPGKVREDLIKDYLETLNK